MDKSFWIMILQLVIFLPFVLALVYLSLKVGGGKFMNLQQGKFIKVYERTQLSKENSLIVVKIGMQAYVVASTAGKIEIIKELNEYELEEIQTQKTIPEFNNMKELLEKLKNRGKSL